MKAGWEVRPLGELCQIALGSTPARNNARFWDKEKQSRNVWVSIADLLHPGLHPVCNDSKEYVSDDATQNMRVVPTGTLLVSFKLTLGRLAYAGRDLFTNEAIASLLEIDESIILKPYLYWALTAFDWHAAAEGDHKIKGKTLNKKKLKLIPIPLPPLEEQKQIVAILDEAFEGLDRARANIEANLEDASSIFHSKLNTIFTSKINGWSSKPLADSVRFIDYRGKTPKKTEDGIRLITAKNVRMGFIQETPKEYVSEDSYNSWMTRGIPKIGDVLFTTEAPLGFVCQLDTDERVVFAQRIITLQPDRKYINPTFLKWALMSDEMQNRIHENATGATAQGIKASLLKKVLIPRAPLSEQESVVNLLNELSNEALNLEALYANKLTDLADLRQSLLQKAFAGELT